MHKEGSFPTFIGFITNPPRDVRRTTRYQLSLIKLKTPLPVPENFCAVELKRNRFPKNPSRSHCACGGNWFDFFSWCCQMSRHRSGRVAGGTAGGHSGRLDRRHALPGRHRGHPAPRQVSYISLSLCKRLWSCLWVPLFVYFSLQSVRVLTAKYFLALITKKLSYLSNLWNV